MLKTSWLALGSLINSFPVESCKKVRETKHLQNSFPGESRRGRGTVSELRAGLFKMLSSAGCHCWYEIEKTERYSYGSKNFWETGCENPRGLDAITLPCYTTENTLQICFRMVSIQNRVLVKKKRRRNIRIPPCGWVNLGNRYILAWIKYDFMICVCFSQFSIKVFKEHSSTEDFGTGTYLQFIPWMFQLVNSEQASGLPR